MSAREVNPGDDETAAAPLAGGPWLVLDTATPLISVAVVDTATAVVVAENTAEVSMRHGEHLAPQIVAALDAAGLERGDLVGVAAGIGPGPYTGLRVGVVTAKVLALALGVPAIGLISHDAVGWSRPGSAHPGQEASAGWVVTTDARRKELFWAAYDGEGRRVEGPFVDRPGRVAEAAGDRLVVGVGPQLYPADFAGSVIGPAIGPTAAGLARLLASGLAQTHPAEPLYLRRPDAVAAHPPKPVTG